MQSFSITPFTQVRAVFLFVERRIIVANLLTGRNEDHLQCMLQAETRVP